MDFLGVSDTFSFLTDTTLQRFGTFFTPLTKRPIERHGQCRVLASCQDVRALSLLLMTDSVDGFVERFTRCEMSFLKPYSQQQIDNRDIG